MTDEQAAEIAGKKSPEPDWVNKKGFRFWLDRHIHLHDILKTKYKIRVWLVIDDKGTASRLISCKNELIFESQQLEAIGLSIRFI